MTTGSILLALALFLVVALFVARPFLLPPARPSLSTEKEALLAEKEALLAQINALDFDAQTSKQDDETYQLERAQLLQAAAAIMTQLDQVGEDEVEQAINRAVARIRRQPAAVGAPPPHQSKDDPIHFCPNCGRAVADDDRFCPNCGRALR